MSQEPHTFDNGIQKTDVGRFTYGVDTIVCHRFSPTPASIKLGSFCSIAAGVQVFLDGDHRSDWCSTYPFGLNYNFHHHYRPDFIIPADQCINKGDIIINDDVWIGLNATIMSGVTIGAGAIIAAQAVVTKNVAPYEVIGGNPAKHIRYRFSQEIIDLLLQLKWWELPFDDIQNIVPILCNTPDVAQLQNLIKQYR